MRWHHLLALAGILAASSAYAVTCTNSGGDAAAIQSSLNAGGTTVVAGTCALGGTSLNFNVANTTLTGTATLNYTGGGYLANLNADGITINGLTIKGGGITASEDGSHWRSHITITNNDIKEVHAPSAPNGINFGGIARFWTITGNTIENIGPGTWGPSTPVSATGLTGCYSTNTCDFNGMGISIYGGVDNTTIEHNVFQWIASDAIHTGWNYIAAATGGFYFLTANNSMSYNEFRHIHRISIESQGVWSWPNCGPGGAFACEAGNQYTTVKYLSNYTHDVMYPYTDSYCFSIVDGGDGNIANNSCIINTTGTPPGGRYGYGEETFTTGGNRLVQGNVYDGISGSGGWSSTIGYGGTGPGITLQIQDNVFCGDTAGSPGTLYTVEPNWNGTLSTPYNWTGTLCLNNSAINTSSITPAFTGPNNRSFPSGGNGTWNASVVSNLSIKWVQFFIDGSGTAAAVQELQDVNTNFANDKKWLYHATINTSSLAGGSHTITATATDVSGAISNATQTFTVGASTTVPNVVGLTQSGASSVITSAGFVVGPIINQLSATVPSGNVISQSPAAGASAASGSTVTLTVSSGNGGATTVSCPTTAAPGTSFVCTSLASVAWSKPAGSVAIVPSVNATSVTVTAPSATVYANHSEGGCPITPSDSIYSTPITNLPVNPLSATWIGNLAGITVNQVVSTWEPNVSDNSSIFTVNSPLYYYSTRYNNVPIKIAPFTSPATLASPRKEEHGSTWGTLVNQTQGFTQDHHMVTINASDCTISEVYKHHGPLAISGTTCNRTGQAGSTLGCFASSAWQYPGYGYLEPAPNTLDTNGDNGTTDAGGLPLEPLTMQYDELLAASMAGTAVAHPLRFTPVTGYVGSEYNTAIRTESSVASGGSGYQVGDSLTVVQTGGSNGSFLVTGIGGGGAVTNISLQNGGSGYAHTNSAATTGGHGTGATLKLSVCDQCTVLWPATGTTGTGINVPPMGSWFRLSPGYTPGGTCAALCLTIVKTLQQYGGIVADLAGGWQLNLGTSIYSHPDGVTAAAQVQSLNIPLASFSIIDPSSLMLDKDISHGNYLNLGYSPWTAANPANGFQTIPNSMVVCGGSTCVPISITPVTIGFQEEYQWVIGGSSFVPKLYKNGSTAPTTYAITACSTGPGTCGTYAAGTYTAPALTCGTEATATITASVGAAVATAYLALVPPATAICPLAFDNGGSTIFTGADSTKWFPDTYVRYSQFPSTSSSPNFAFQPNGVANVDHQIYDTGPYGPDDIVIAPIQGMAPGNYNVSIYQGQGGGGNFGDCDSRLGQWSYSANLYAMYMEAGGVISKFNIDPLAAVGNLCLTPLITTIPMVVGANGIGSVALRSSQNPANNFAATFASVSGIKIVPATGVTKAITLETEKLVDHIYPGNTAQFYDVPQWIGATYDPLSTIWTLSSGPGSIDSTGLYTAPAAGPIPIRVASGDPVATFTNSYATFLPDQYYNGGTANSTCYGTAISVAGVTNPAPTQVYQCNRYGFSPFSYVIPGMGASTTVQVRLHFAEQFCTAAGCNVLTVKINGATVLTNFDIWASVGFAQAVVKEFTATADASGVVTIEFDPAAGKSCEISGIEVIPINAPNGFIVTAPAVIQASNSSTGTTYTATKSITVVGSQYPLNQP